MDEEIKQEDYIDIEKNIETTMIITTTTTTTSQMKKITSTEMLIETTNPKSDQPRLCNVWMVPRSIHYYMNERINNLHGFIYYYIHALIIITFESFFYFLYATSYEKQSIVHLLNKLFAFIPSTILKLIYELLSQIDTQIYSSQMCHSYQQDTKVHNENLYNHVIIGLISAYMFLILLVIVEIKTTKNGITKIVKYLKKSILLVLFMSVFEYLFFMDIVSQYLVLSPQEILCQIQPYL